MAKKSSSRKSTPKKKAKSAATEPKAERPYAPDYGIVGPKDGEGLLPWSWVASQMDKSRTFWISTIHPAGRPHVMPIWGVWVSDGFYFSTGRKSRKGQNIAANPACTITNENAEDAVILEGIAEEVSDRTALDAMAAGYKKKYKMDPRSMGSPIFVVRPKTVFGLIEKSFPRSATRWRL